MNGEDHSFETKHGRADFAARDRIQFTGTDKGKGLTNGAAGTIERIEGDKIAVLLDGRDAARVEFDAKEFQDFRHGYAGTIYKGQGRTLDQTYLYHSEHWRSAASYVGLTRHRDETALFVARDTADDVKQLARQMARVDDRRAASRFHTQGEDLAPARPPRVEELKAELDRLMGDISRQLGAEARTQAPARSGFEHWAESPGMVAQERSAMRAARAHAPPAAPPPVKEAAQAPEKDPLESEIARMLGRTAAAAPQAATAARQEPAKTATPSPTQAEAKPAAVVAREPGKQPEPVKTAPAAPPSVKEAAQAAEKDALESELARMLGRTEPAAAAPPPAPAARQEPTKTATPAPTQAEAKPAAVVAPEPAKQPEPVKAETPAKQAEPLPTPTPSQEYAARVLPDPQREAAAPAAMRGSATPTAPAKETPPRAATPEPAKQQPQPAKTPTHAPMSFNSPLTANQVFARFGDATLRARYQQQEEQRQERQPTSAPATPATPASSMARGNVPAEKQAEQKATEEKEAGEKYYFTRETPDGKPRREQ